MKPPFASFGMAWLAAVSRQLWMASATATHPLDGLTATEYTSLLEILTAAGHVSETTRFPIIHLHEPHKDAVQSWTAGEVIPRVAEAILKEGPKSYKTKVDLVAKSVLSFEPAEGEGMILFEEFMGATELALSSPEIVAGLAARGIKPEEVYCAPLTAGSFNDPMEVGKRLLKVPCVKLPTGNNYFSMPVEGLFALIDLNAMEGEFVRRQVHSVHSVLLPKVANIGNANASLIAYLFFFLALFVLCVIRSISFCCSTRSGRHWNCPCQHR